MSQTIEPTPSVESVPQVTALQSINAVPACLVPKGAKVILPAEKVTPEVKRERTAKQQEAYKKMRQALDESRQKRQFSRKEALSKIDEMKEEERKMEEREVQQKAEELKAQGVDVVVQKRRGRKPGEKIPYGGKVKEESQEDVLRRVISEVVSKGMMGQAPPPMYHPPEPSKPHLNIDAPSPSVAEAYKQTVHQPVKEVFENPYLAMIRRRKR